MHLRNVLLIGGSGFVGSAIAARLSGAGVNVLVPSRRRERAKALILLPTVEVVEAQVHDEVQLAQLVRGMDAVEDGAMADFERGLQGSAIHAAAKGLLADLDAVARAVAEQDAARPQ